MASRVTWSDLKKRRRGGAQIREGYVAARAGYRLAERVRTLREHRGLSQQDLADRIGSTQSAVSRLESGGAEPSLTTLERIGRALDAELVVEFANALPKPKPSTIARATKKVRRIVRRSPRRSFAKKSAQKR